jgi:hypothetical protein
MSYPPSCGWIVPLCLALPTCATAQSLSSPQEAPGDPLQVQFPAPGDPPPPDATESGQSAPNFLAPESPRPGNPFENLGGLGGPNGLGNGYRLIGFSSEPVKGQPTSLAEFQERLSFGVPIWRSNPDAVLLTVKLGDEYFSGSAVLPNRDRAFPRDLWDVGVGVMYSHRFDNGWDAGVRVGVESPSDQPFSTWNEMGVSFSGFLRIPVHDNRDAWLLSLNYSPNGELNFPLPGVAYFWQPSDDLHMTIGLPLSIMYRPIPDLKLECSYVPVRNVHARATYRLCDPVDVYAAFDWNSEAYYLTDRPNERDRFYEYDKRASLGVQTHITPHLVFSGAAGYVFDRFFFEGQNYNDRNLGQIDVGNGAFGELRVQYRF